MQMYRWHYYIYWYRIILNRFVDHALLRYDRTIKQTKITTEKYSPQNMAPELCTSGSQALTDRKQTENSLYLLERGQRCNEQLANFRSKTSNFIKKEAEVIWRWCSTVNMSQIEYISAKLYSSAQLRGLATNLHTSKLTLETGAEVWHIEILSTAVVSDSQLCVVKGTVASNPQTLRWDHFQDAPSHSHIWRV